MKLKKLALVAALMAAGTALAANDPSTSATAKTDKSVAPQPAASASASTNQPSASASAATDTSASKPAGDESVRQLQQALKDKGFDPGPVDGVMGPRTQAAMDQAKSAGASIPGASASASTSSNSFSSPSATQPSASTNQPSASQPSASTNQPSAAAETSQQMKQ